MGGKGDEVGRGGKVGDAEGEGQGQEGYIGVG